MLPADVVLTPVIEPEFQELRQLAERIWQQHYTGMISTAQIDHMLDSRFSDDALRTYSKCCEWRARLSAIVVTRSWPRSPSR